MTASPNSAARAPSTTRWSNVSATSPIGRTTTSPSRTTGRGGDPADAEDRDLRMVDDRRLEEAGELAGARHGERRAAELVGRERAGAGGLGEARDLGGELVDRALVSQPRTTGTTRPVVGLHGDADVVAVEVDDLVSLEPRVQLRELLRATGAHGLEHRRRRAASRSTRLEVALLDPGHRRHLAVRARHVLGDQRAERRAAARGVPPGRPGDRPAAAHVLLGDLAVRAGAGDDRRGRRRAPGRSCGRAASRGRAPPGRVWDRSWGLSLGHGRCGHGLLRPARPVLADHDEHRPDRDDLALGDEDPRDLPGRRRRDLDRRLVGLDLDERIVLGDLLALRDEPAGDLALGQALAEVGQLELVGHRGRDLEDALPHRVERLELDRCGG